MTCIVACTTPGHEEARAAGVKPDTPCSSGLAVCRPTLSRRVRRLCPWHKRCEYGTLYDEHSYYAPRLVWDCGTIWDADSGWERPRCRFYGSGFCSNPVKATIVRIGKSVEVCGVHRRSALAQGLEEAAP